MEESATQLADLTTSPNKERSVIEMSSPIIALLLFEAQKWIVL